MAVNPDKPDRRDLLPDDSAKSGALGPEKLHERRICALCADLRLPVKGHYTTDTEAFEEWEADLNPFSSVRTETDLMAAIMCDSHGICVSGSTGNLGTKATRGCAHWIPSTLQREMEKADGQ